MSKFMNGNMTYGYSAAHVIGLTDEQIAAQLAFAARRETDCKKRGNELPGHLALQRYQLEAERMRRDGVCP